MQKLTIISGLKQEGKTRELFDSYKNHFLGDITYKDGSTIATRLMLRPVFITATNENPIMDYCTLLMNEEKDITSFNNEKDMLIETHKFYNEVKEKGELFNIMTSNLMEDDCTFYLDGMDDVASIDELLDLMNSFPSDVSKKSCDIVVTRFRNRK